MRKEIIINFKNLKVSVEDLFRSKVVKSGTGAAITARKRHLGKECIVIVGEVLEEK